MENLNLNVQGIASASCIKIINSALSHLEGIRSVHVDWESGRVQVQRKSHQYDDIIHALMAVGYSASLDLDEQNS
ncbi:heavy-metal-associated domain-containing protein [Polynucleobacter sp. MG-27-Goln-C1]|uniref:heavy-metal-associated domain-containing protein n=1 Tax=Polynucleobacter sp. MG-27-Goln-C1 TaxID=1819726 RepID=UPI001C0B9BCF|nr:heavy metal-associated domain-containing protein [Polynucleobacter sp. MG-27-Goln-C1]MBU3613257.1 heavy-metal-associated domain-containing protein [Polynucleobacter sp. MG-27-Goln-C1]